MALALFFWGRRILVTTIEIILGIAVVHLLFQQLRAEEAQKPVKPHLKMRPTSLPRTGPGPLYR
jgi:hypothetical protein